MPRRAAYTFHGAGIVAVLAIGLAGCSPSTPPTPTTASATTSATNAPQVSSTPAQSTGTPNGVDTFIPPNFNAGSITAVGPQIWITTGHDVLAVDFPSKQVHSVSVDAGNLDDISAGKDAVWAADFDGSDLIKIDPQTYKVVDRIHVPSAEGAIELNGTVWVTDHEEGTVTLVDAGTDKVAKTVTIDTPHASGPQNIAYGLGSVWITVPGSNNVVRVNPATDAIVATIPMPQYPPCGDIATTSQAVWVTGCSHIMYKIDPTTNQVVATATLASDGDTPIVIDDSIWIVITDEIDHLDAASAKVDAQVSVPEVTGGSSVLVGQTLYVADGVSVHAVPLSLFADGAVPSP